LLTACAEWAPDDIVITWRDDYVPQGDEWPWEIVGLFERHADTVAVCGRFYRASGELERAGEVFGFQGLAGSPVASSNYAPSGYHGLLFCQRTVGVVTPMCFAARAGFLRAALASIPLSPSWDMLGLWLGAYAAQSGSRILYTPHLVCRQQAQPDWSPQRSDREVVAFLERNAELLREHRWYGRHLSLRPSEGYGLTTQVQREVVIRGTLARLWHGEAESPESPRELLVEAR
jgi:hypothetical protein